MQDHNEVKDFMQDFGHWGFDVIELDRLSRGNSLYLVSMKGVAKLVVR